MAVTQKQLIDITLLGKYDELIKKFIEDKETALNTTIGTLPEGAQDVVSYINAQVEGINGAADDLEERVAKNELAIGHAKDADHAESSGLYLYTDNAAKAAVDKVVDGATDKFDTLKEIAEWIASDTTGAAKMANDIAALQGSETDTSAAVSIVGAKKYADEKVADKNVDAEGETGDDALVTASAEDNAVTIASTKKLKDAVALAETSVQTVTKDTSVETYVTIAVVDGDDATVALDDSALVTKIGAAKGDTDATGMYADIQGATNATVKDVEEKVDALVLAEESQITALFEPKA